MHANDTATLSRATLTVDSLIGGGMLAITAAIIIAAVVIGRQWKE